MNTPENQTPKPKREDTSAESLAALAYLRACATREADNNAAAPLSRVLNTLGLWGEKNTRKARDSVADALSRALADLLNRKGADLAPEVLADQRKWAAEDANPEALAAWLDRDGWKKVNGTEVEAALVKAARARNEAEGLKDGLSCVVWNQGAPYFVLFYDTARADRKKPDVLARISQKQTEGPRYAFSAALLSAETTEPRTPPDGVTVLLGLDALKAGLQGFDWSGLSLCLTDKADRAADWLGRLAVEWLADRIEAQAEKRKRFAGAFSIEIREKSETRNGKWTPLPRALDAAAVLGGPFKMDGETYAGAPEMAGAAVGRALRPRALDIVHADWLDNKPQLTLALDLNIPTEAVKEYMIETAARTAHLGGLPNMCPKLLGFMFAAAPMTASPVKGTLLELAHWLYPDWKDRRQSSRDLKGLGLAFVAVKGLRLVATKPDGTLHPYDLFTMDYDLSSKPETELGFMINPWLATRMQGGAGGGYFLVNMTRWLAMDIRNPRLFPLALRLASLWDKARVRNGPYDPGLLKPILADRLAWECNTLSEGAAMFRTGKTDARTAKAALHATRDNLEADLDTLKEAGLLGEWEKKKVHGQGFELRPIPPADYAEACILAARNIKKKTAESIKKQGKQKG